MGKAKTKVVVEATITRADGTVEDLGIISRDEADIFPDWFKELQGTDQYQVMKQEGKVD